MIIYSPTGRRTDATEENAAQMVEYCGYSYEWPPAKQPAMPLPAEGALAVEGLSTAPPRKKVIR